MVLTRENDNKSTINKLKANMLCECVSLESLPMPWTWEKRKRPPIYWLERKLIDLKLLDGPGHHPQNKEREREIVRTKASFFSFGCFCLCVCCQSESIMYTIFTQ